MKRRTSFSGASLLLLAALGLLLVFPLVRILLTAFSGGFSVDAGELTAALKNSLISTVIATALTVTLAYLAAYAMTRVGVWGRGLFGVLLVLPMLIPSISNGMGLVILLGNNGILTRLFGLDGGIYGLFGIVLGSFLYAFPVAYLMLADVMRYEDASPHEAARVLGIGRWRRFTGLTLPYLARPLLSAVFATFTLIITDYGVPLTVGGKYITVPVVLYREVVGQLDFGKGAVYGCVLLVPAVAAFLFDLFGKKEGKTSFVSKPFTGSVGMGARIVATAFCTLTSLVMLMPTVAFLLRGFATKYPSDLSPTFSHLIRAFRLRAGEYLWHSVLIALLTAVIFTAIAFFAAYLAARTRARSAKLLHLLAMTTAAVPGLVLGLGYALAFRGGAFYGTFAILVMVNGVHFLASPYLMIYNSLGKLNAELEGVGQTLGLSRVRVVLGVLLPQCHTTLLEMASYFFVNCMMTISAVSFLATASTRPLSLMITQFEAQQQMECAAIVSLMILAVNLLVRGAVGIFKRRA